MSGCRALLSELPGRIKKTVNVELDTFCSSKVDFLSTHLKVLILLFLLVYKTLATSSASYIS